MIISAIAAIDRAGLIGDGIKMPWRLPRDLRRFRKLTLGKPVVMGRTTLESLPAPLDDRLNIVLTRNRGFHAEGCRVAGSIEDALKIAEEYAGRTGGNEVMIIGGGAVFAETVSLWDHLLLTVVGGDFQGDTYFPLERLKGSRWHLVERAYCPPDLKNVHPHWFLSLEQRKIDSAATEDFDLFAWLADCWNPALT